MSRGGSQLAGMKSAGLSERPLRILQIIEPSGGGSGRHFIDLCGGLSERGHHVHAIFSPVRAEERFVRELRSRGLARVDAVPMSRAPSPSDVSVFRRVSQIRRGAGPFDIVHGHSSKAGGVARLRFPGRHTPRVYTPHAFRTMDPTLGSAGRLVYGGVEVLLGRFFSDHIICVSDEEYRHALAVGIPADRLSVVVNGVSPPPEIERDSIRARLGIPEAAFVFGFVGRLSPQKAPERLVQAFGQIADRFSGAHVLMIGSGELDGEVRAEIARCGASDRVHLAQDISGPVAMAAFDALVMSSRYEAMSYVMLEAAAAGKPIVTTDIGGAATVVKDGENGRIVANDDDTTALADAMLTLSEPAVRSRFTTAALARRSGYSVDRMIDLTETVYRRLAGQ